MLNLSFRRLRARFTLLAVVALSALLLRSVAFAQTSVHQNPPTHLLLGNDALKLVREKLETLNTEFCVMGGDDAFDRL